MTTYWVLILGILVVAAIFLLVALNRPNKGSSSAERAEERASGYKPATPSPWKAEKPVLKSEPEKPVTFKKPPEKTTKPPEKKPIVKPPEPVIVKPHTTVYEYTPTRGVVRCPVCDGENPHGSAMCSICGNYLNY